MKITMFTSARNGMPFLENCLESTLVAAEGLDVEILIRRRLLHRWQCRLPSDLLHAERAPLRQGRLTAPAMHILPPSPFPVPGVS